jgi:spore coat polysaccharide biosynthesis protein SpsF
MKRKLVAVIACRNNSSRLYAKPLQFLDYDSRITILDCIIASLKSNKNIKQIILGISNHKDNLMYKEFAKLKKINFFFGSDKDVLLRLIKGAFITDATDIFRVTSESPFISLDYIGDVWQKHIKLNNDLTIFSNNIDGMGFEIFTKDSLKKSHKKGDQRHRSELCDLYIRENIKDFRVKYITKKLTKNKYRLTVDNPEDLILCRKLFLNLKKNYPKFKQSKIIKFLTNKKNVKDIKLVNQFIKKSKTIDNLWKNV